MKTATAAQVTRNTGNDLSYSNPAQPTETPQLHLFQAPQIHLFTPVVETKPAYNPNALQELISFTDHNPELEKAKQELYAGKLQPAELLLKAIKIYQEQHQRPVYISPAQMEEYRREYATRQHKYTRIKTGTYTHFKLPEGGQVLTFIPDKAGIDYEKKAGQILLDYYGIIPTGTAPAASNKGYEQHKELSPYIHYLQYSIYGVVISTLLLQFDYEKEEFTIRESQANGRDADIVRTWKVKDSREYTYKFLKKEIQAINGIAGLYKNIAEFMNPGSAFHNWFDGALRQQLVK
jgi:hypothetical protein